LDKAPDAFRTISEVADDLDIPQHVLRFWETRFTQIKPMKRSGGRRYYRPDDVDLLRGIRRLLYGEGYTIRGVQRILKEHGIKAVQGLVDGSAAPAFTPGADSGRHAVADDHDDDIESVTETEQGVDEEAATQFVIRREPQMQRREPVKARPSRVEAPIRSLAHPVTDPSRPASPVPNETDRLTRAKLEIVLNELAACRQLLDAALKDG
jgi:DNA-binding transcriptional MerR regulator